MISKLGKLQQVAYPYILPFCFYKGKAYFAARADVRILHNTIFYALMEQEFIFVLFFFTWKCEWFYIGN